MQAVYVEGNARKHWCRGEKGDRPGNRGGCSPPEPAGACIYRTPWVVARTAEIYVVFPYSLFPWEYDLCFWENEHQILLEAICLLEQNAGYLSLQLCWAEMAFGWGGDMWERFHIWLLIRAQSAQPPVRPLLHWWHYSVLGQVESIFCHEIDWCFSTCSTPRDV